MRAAGVTAEQIARRIMEMIGRLHGEGYEGLYLDCGMAPSGLFWRYQIGIIVDGRWPAYDDGLVYGSIGGGFDQVIPWCAPSDDLAAFVAKFKAMYGKLLGPAKAANAAYAAWYRRMLKATAPEGVLIFYADYGPSGDYAVTWGPPDGFQMPLPPGYRGA